MNVLLHLLCKVHNLFLKLYPQAYGAEYSEEMQTVFELSLNDAAERGVWRVVGRAADELVSLPGAVLYQHVRERRKTMMLKRFSSHLDFAHGSGLEFLTAFFPFFLLGGVLPIINLLGASGVIPVPNPLLDGIGIVLMALFLLLFAIGLIVGLPRWVLPYLGGLLTLSSVYIFSQWVDNKIPYYGLYHTSWFLGQVAYQGSLWIGLSVVALLMTALIRFAPALRKFRHDWTLPSFILYSAAPFALLFTFDDYVHEELWELLAFVILGIGMWFYLHSDDPRKRYRALFGSMTAALFIAAVAKALIFSSPSWPWPRQSFSWQNEMMSTVIMWMWIALSFLLSAASSLRLNSRSASPSG